VKFGKCPLLISGVLLALVEESSFGIVFLVGVWVVIGFSSLSYDYLERLVMIAGQFISIGGLLEYPIPTF
jgi:hypothetical protein